MLPIELILTTQKLLKIHPWLPIIPIYRSANVRLNMLVSDTQVSSCWVINRIYWWLPSLTLKAKQVWISSAKKACNQFTVYLVLFQTMWMIQRKMVCLSRAVFMWWKKVSIVFMKAQFLFSFYNYVIQHY